MSFSRTITLNFLKNNNYADTLSVNQILPFVSSRRLLTFLTQNKLLVDDVAKTSVDELLLTVMERASTAWPHIKDIKADGILAVLEALEMIASAKEAKSKIDKRILDDETLLRIYHNNAISKNKPERYPALATAPSTHPVGLEYVKQMAMLGWDQTGANLVSVDSVMPSIHASNTIYVRFDLCKEIENTVTWPTEPTGGSFRLKIIGPDLPEITTEPIPVGSTTHPSIIIRAFIESALRNAGLSDISAYVCGKFSGASRWSPGSYKSGFGIRLLSAKAPTFCETIDATITVIDNHTNVVPVTTKLMVNAWCDHLDEEGVPYVTDDLISTYGLSWERHANFILKKLTPWEEEFRERARYDIQMYIDFEDGFGFFDIKNRKINQILNYHFLDKFDGFSTWEIADDRAQLLQNALNFDRTIYLERIIEPLRKYCSLIGNYDHRHFTSSEPQGWLSDRSNCSYGVGYLVGNCQMKNLYGGFEPVETSQNPLKFGIQLSPKESKLVAVPQDRIKIKNISQNEDKITVNIYDKEDIEKFAGSGNSVFLEGIEVGSKVWLEDNRNLIGAVLPNPTTTLLEVIEKPTEFTLVLKSPISKTVPLISNIPFNASQNVWLNIHHPWNTFVTAINKIRQMSITSSAKKGIFISAKKWMLDYRESLLYEEMLLHALFQNSNLVYWNSDTTKTGGGPKDPNDDNLVNDILTYFNTFGSVGPKKELSINYEMYNRQNDLYVLSGFECCGKRYWRLTPNNDEPIAWSVNKEDFILYHETEPIVKLKAKILDSNYGGLTLENNFDMMDVPAMFFN